MRDRQFLVASIFCAWAASALMIMFLFSAKILSDNVAASALMLEGVIGILYFTGEHYK